MYVFATLYTHTLGKKKRTNANYHYIEDAGFFTKENMEYAKSGC